MSLFHFNYFRILIICFAAFSRSVYVGGLVRITVREAMLKLRIIDIPRISMLFVAVFLSTSLALHFGTPAVDLCLIPILFKEVSFILRCNCKRLCFKEIPMEQLKYILLLDKMCL